MFRINLNSHTYKLELVRFYADYRIKRHAPLLGLISVNFFEFLSCEITTQAEYLRVSLKNQIIRK